MPLCCHGELKERQAAQGRGFDPRPMEEAHPKGSGQPVVQPATGRIGGRFLRCVVEALLRREEGMNQ
jgi:hypothetical protein